MNSSTKAFRALDGVRHMFYLVTPDESSFEKIEHVPDYVHQATVFFILFIILEMVYVRFNKKDNRRAIRTNAAISSMSAGLTMRMLHILMKNFEVNAYIWVFENYHIVSLPWNSAWTWWACFLGVDLAYYWFHRMAHEVNFMWGAHQAHHSSEDYNLATALRQSAFQQVTSWMFYLPLALFIPSPMFIAHIQFNLLYQFWIHTEVIGKLGPLEWILNTPSHHRVHHGRNRYCIDKNYAATLIVWDRIFGTFEPENEEVVYGLTHTLESFDPIEVQLCHYKYMWGILREANSWSERLSIIFKGPGWGPGKPRLGLIEDIPDVHAPVQKYHPRISAWEEVYMIVHLLVTVVIFQELYIRQHDFSCLVVTVFIAYILLCLTAVGATLDGKPSAPILHLLGAVLFLVGQRAIGSPTILEAPFNEWLLQLLQVYSIATALFWAYKCASGGSEKKQN